MADILNITGLGRLEIVETYIYYDQPVLFSCKSAAGHFYLGVATDKNDERETWLYVGVSVKRLNRIRSGAIDLHDAFAKPEDGFLLQETIPYDDQTQPRMESIQPDQISEDMLPMPGECLDLEIETLPELRDSEEIAKYGKREVLNLTLNFDGPFTSEAPVTALSQILEKFQGVINAIGMHHFDLKRINKDIKRKMQMSFLKVGAGSFDIQLASTYTTDFFESSDCGNAIEKFLNLLAAGSNQEQLKLHIEELQSRVAKDYTAFLKSLNESVIDVKFKWVSPHPNGGRTVHLSDHQIHEALEAIEVIEKYDKEISQPFRITGKLTGAFLSSKRFRIETMDQTYKGIIADPVIRTVRNATLSQNYTATIRKITERSDSTGNTKTSHELLELIRDH